MVFPAGKHLKVNDLEILKDIEMTDKRSVQGHQPSITKKFP